MVTKKVTPTPQGIENKGVSGTIQFAARRRKHVFGKNLMCKNSMLARGKIISCLRVLI